MSSALASAVEGVIAAVYNWVEYEAGGGVPILDTIDPGLGESLQLSAVGRGAGIVIGGTDGMCRGIETALACEGTGELVDDKALLVILRSSIALSVGADEIWSYNRSAVPPSATTTSRSDTPRSWRSVLSFLFSSRTLRAALWISDEASIPICSLLRSFASSSCKYSLRLARERPSQCVTNGRHYLGNPPRQQ